MAHDRHILPSNYHPPQHLGLEAPRSRQPLTDSTGNVQYHALASAGVYHGHKGLQSRVDHAPSRFTLPTLPSQPHVPLATSLEARRNKINNQRSRLRRNPIEESTQYQAYRARQVKDSEGDAKWPADLEDAFLDGTSPTYS